MLYQHQKRIVDDDPHKCGLWLGTGGGKTRTALMLGNSCINILVVAPKTQVEDKNWEREAEALVRERMWKGMHVLTVISKETFRRDWEKLPKPDVLIVDEAHTMLGVQPALGWKKRERVVKTSQLYAALKGFVQMHDIERLYLCTATPTRNPMCVWGAARLLGKTWDFMKFRDAFYFQLPMPGREVWTPRRDDATKERLAKAVRSLGYAGKLDDWFDVPEQTDRTVYVELTAAQKMRIKHLELEYPDPLVLIGKTHQVENGCLSGDEFKAEEEFDNAKLEKFLDLCAEFPKVVVFAKYLKQIAQIEAAAKKAGKKTFVLTGATKNRGDLIKAAEAAEDAVFIAQSQVSSGYELPSFPCVIYASLSYSVVDLEQSRGRVLRANALKKNLYVYLVTRGGIDEAVYKTVMDKKDFNEAIYLESLDNKK